MAKKIGQVLTLFLALILLAAATDPPFKARVVKVKDGDSFVAVYDGKIQVEVRLFGVDAPEKGQPYSDYAREFVSKLIYQQTVTIIPQDRDAYKRIVAEVILPDGRSLNEELVKAGWAWWYRQYAPDNRKLETLEAAARAGKAGLWADPKPPVPPWDWRRKNESARESQSGEFCASRNSKVYHLCACDTVSTIYPENLIRFKTEEEAKKSGRVRCKCQK